ncbi:MAG: hypothetical protein J7L14_03495 [Candidatus Diapherotrites archaeon]|nr:hypothetical protein [Candidatus Diapherotrites archaeon]
MAKRIVIPGEVLTSERKRLGQHVFIRDGKIVADCLGIFIPEAPVASVIPLKGRYVPKENDVIVGIVVEEKFAGYVVDINSFYYSFVLKEGIRQNLKRGAIISAKVANVNEVNGVELTNVRILPKGGEIISVVPVKVPRIIGKNASMLKVLKEGSGSQMIVGKNGWIWVRGGNIPLLEKAIRKIEEEAHLSNLTNKIANMFKEKR